MRMSAVQPVQAPPEAVFARLADFEMFETRAMRRGVPVRRLAEDPPAWRIGIDWRGVVHQVDLEVGSVTAPQGYTALVATRGIDGRAAVDIAADAPGSTVTVALRLEGQGLAGRMVLQTLSFARPALEGRLRGGLARLAAEIEAAQQG